MFSKLLSFSMVMAFLAAALAMMFFEAALLRFPAMQ